MNTLLFIACIFVMAGWMGIVTRTLDVEQKKNPVLGQWQYLKTMLITLFVFACVGAVALLVGGGFGFFWLAHHVHIT